MDKKTEGWKRVPLRETEVMLAAGHSAFLSDRLRRSTTLYRAMTEVAPVVAGEASEGSVWVPLEPTDAMLAAGQKAWLKDRSLSALYRAMVEAAPAVPQQALEGTSPLSLKVMGHECSVLMPREQYVALSEDIGLHAVEQAMTAAGAVARSVSYVPLEPCEVQFEVEAGKDPQAVAAAIAGLLMGGRPSREVAERVVAEFLDREKPDYPTFSLAEDGDDGWAFWIDPEDTTSYLHPNLRIEWYGSRWPDRVDYNGLTGDFVERANPAPAARSPAP